MKSTCKWVMRKGEIKTAVVKVNEILEVRK